VNSAFQTVATSKWILGRMGSTLPRGITPPGQQQARRECELDAKHRKHCRTALEQRAVRASQAHKKKEKQQQQLRGAKTRLYEERNTVSGRRAEHELRAELWEINMAIKQEERKRASEAAKEAFEKKATSWSHPFLMYAHPLGPPAAVGCRPAPHTNATEGG